MTTREARASLQPVQAKAGASFGATADARALLQPLEARATGHAHGSADAAAVAAIDEWLDAIGKLLPAITLKAVVLEHGEKTEDGTIVRAVAPPWFDILKIIEEDPNSIYQIDPFKWEEIVAGAYTRDGYGVILTPRSGDKGRDVIATKPGYVTVRIFDQVKAYKPGHLVTAEEVRAMIGVLTGAQNVSKGLVTTTSEFAPRIADDAFIKPFIPYQLDLKPRDALLAWLRKLARKTS